MKDAIWIGILASVLASVAGATENQPQVDEPVELPKLSGYSGKTYYKFNEEGGVLLINESGQSVLINKDTVSLIQKMKFQGKPGFENSNPCMATTLSKKQK